jgi:SAM-dependent methyltransferase
MTTSAVRFNAAATAPAVRTPDPHAIRALYAQTLDDYRAWSPGYNMHFGYRAPGMSPFAREPMLERMNHEVVGALKLPVATPARVVDLGCGAGATARAIARANVRATVVGVTLVREQISLAARLNRRSGVGHRIAFVHSDFADTWMASHTFDGAVAVESFCYDAGPDKAGALREAARLLKPGARLVVVDGFLKGPEPTGILGWIYRTWCDCWSIAELAQVDAFTEALRRAGFRDIEVRDLFWQIAPSAAHIPWVAFTHTLKALLRGRISAWRWRHIASSLLSVPLGLARWKFRYCQVSAVRVE